ncbi:hypothetical protein D3C72_2277700 [compost metagenome]
MKGAPMALLIIEGKVTLGIVDSADHGVNLRHLGGHSTGYAFHGNLGRTDISAQLIVLHLAAAGSQQGGTEH